MDRENLIDTYFTEFKASSEDKKKKWKNYVDKVLDETQSSDIDDLETEDLEDIINYGNKIASIRQNRIARNIIAFEEDDEVLKAFDLITEIEEAIENEMDDIEQAIVFESILKKYGLKAQPNVKDLERKKPRLGRLIADLKKYRRKYSI